MAEIDKGYKIETHELPVIKGRIIKTPIHELNVVIAEILGSGVAITRGFTTEKEANTGAMRIESEHPRIVAVVLPNKVSIPNYL